MWFLFVAINECDFPELNNCHENAVCTNTFASFVCICDSGYSGNGTDCASKYVELVQLI